IQDITVRLQGLPLQQLQLAELERKAQVAAEIHSAVLARYNQAKISDAVEVPDVFVMDYAIEPEPMADVKNILRLFSIGLALVLGISFGPPVIFDFFDKSVRNESEATKLLPYTFLESIPVIEVAKRKIEKKKKGESPKTSLRLIDPRLITASYTPNLTNEQFRALRSKILLRMHDIDKKKIIVTSYNMNEGKSLISANLAITMAQQKLKTILIDCDIRRGVQHNTFVLQKKPGISELLYTEKTVSPENVLPLIQSTHVPNLSVISSGSNVPNPSELLGHPNFGIFIEILSTMYDVIIADTPPLGLSVDAAIISNLFSAAILVIRSGKTNVINLKKRVDEFPSLKKKILGVVLNEALLDISVKKYKYYSYLY
ncbi:MAG: polysaccharide biosynthesis tyrosine autokinase, partial [Chitinispirillaceae bacterium]|nr:polysaccharide biosynthesis tyrosine autokinase [Chitinispirillaceae bacterium]